MPPNVPNYGRPGKGPRLVEGLALAVEPMIILGHHRDRTSLDDDWTVVTDDGSLVGPLRALVHPHPDGAWSSPRSTAARPSSPSSASPCAA